MEKDERTRLLKAFGDNVRYYRTRLGMTQGELGLKVGYLDGANPAASISKIENGQMEITQSKIADLAKVLGVTPADLFSEKHVDYEFQNDEQKLVVESYMHADEATKRHVWLLLNDKPEKKRPTLSIIKTPDFGKYKDLDVSKMIAIPEASPESITNFVGKHNVGAEVSKADIKEARKIVQEALKKEPKYRRKRRDSGSEEGGFGYVGN